jgi:SET domain-containing protein
MPVVQCNCLSSAWADPLCRAALQVRIGIFALRDVPPGEEMTYDYQFEHYGLHTGSGSSRCRCGAANCR